MITGSHWFALVRIVSRRLATSRGLYAACQNGLLEGHSGGFPIKPLRPLSADDGYRILEVRPPFGGEMGMIGYDHAKNANVALTTFPDPGSAAKAVIQTEAKQLLDVISREMFTTMEELWPVFTGAMG